MVRFTLKQLAYFRCVAETGGIAQAARVLNMSQPSISQALEKLEDVTGLRLFDRHHARGLSLTRQGRAFLQHAIRLEKMVDQTGREVAALASEAAGEIRLGCFHTLAPFFMANLIRTHMSMYPGVIFAPSEGNITELANGVRDGSLDLALTYDLGPDHAGLVLTALASLLPMVVLAIDHPLATGTSIRLKDLAEEPYVLYDAPGSRGYFEDLLTRSGLTPPIAYRSGSLESVRSAVGNGFGFTLLVMRPPDSTSYDGKKLKILEIEGDIEPLRIVLASRGDPLTEPILQRFIETSRRCFWERLTAD